MEHDGWSDWSGDESHPDDTADTADLGHSGDPAPDGLGDFGAGADTPGGFDDAFGGGEDQAPEAGADPGHHLGGAPGLAGESSEDPAGPTSTIGHEGYHEDDPFSHGDYDPASHDDSAPPGDHDGFPPADASADHGPDDHDPGSDQAGDYAADHLIGTDPDVQPHGDDPAWHEPDFPPQLDLAHAPPPVDGYPWSDPTVLGSGSVEDAGHLYAGWGDPNPADMFDYAGISADGGDPWQALLGADDPAANALARWWAPGS